MKIKYFHEITDADLVRSGIASVDEIDTDGPILSNSFCCHDWSTTQEFDDQRYQECSQCGAVQPPGRDIDRLEQQG